MGGFRGTGRGISLPGCRTGRQVLNQGGDHFHASEPALLWILLQRLLQHSLNGVAKFLQGLLTPSCASNNRSRGAPARGGVDQIKKNECQAVRSEERRVGKECR